MQPVVEIRQGKPATTSMNVAEVFGKNHRDVLRSIVSLESKFNERNFAPVDGPNFASVNFQRTDYTDPKGERRPMYIIGRDGFVLLAMGFTGDRALEFKCAYIAEFNRMEAALQGTPPPALSTDEIARRLATLEQMIAQQSQAINRLTQVVTTLNQKLDNKRLTYEGPETAFCSKHCHRGGGYRCPKGDWYDLYLEFCRIHDHTPKSKNQALRQIYQAYDFARPGYIRTDDGKKIPAIIGIKPASPSRN